MNFNLINYNYLENVRLVDSNNELICMINQVKARRLLRQGFCTLLLVKPATVQFFLEKEKWNNRYLNSKYTPKPKEDGFDVLKSVLYGNYHMQSPTGEIMFHTNAGRVLWYLSRDIIDIIADNPPTLRFKNKTNGPGHINDAYYLSDKINQCVVCGINKNLTRHHVVPRVFRVHFPLEIKDHSYHDVLLLCTKCHKKYELKALDLKNALYKEMNYVSKGVNDIDLEWAIKSSKTLLRFQDVIPESKKTEMFNTVRLVLKKQDITDDDLKNVSQLSSWYFPDDYETPSEFVAKNIPDLQIFSERWRKHFLDTMHPQFLPENWDLHKSIYPPN